MIDLLLFTKAAAGDTAGCSLLLANGANPQSESSRALFLAAMNGHVACVRQLIPISNPTAENSIALRWAAMNGHAECVSLLIPVSDPTAEKSQALMNATLNNHLECVKLLFPVSWPAIEKGLIFSQALDNGYAEVVAFFLAREPARLDGLDLPESVDSALASGHASLAALLSSIIDLKALSKAVPVVGARSSPQDTRL